MKEFDVVIAGGGVNGLACASLLTKRGLSVCVVERNDWVGGGAVTREVTVPGFKHDMFGSSHVWIHCNPDFKEIRPELEKHGLKYLWSDDQITGHPDQSGGPGIVIYRSIDKTVESIAAYNRQDAERYRAVHDEFETIKDGFLKAFFSPPVPPSYMAQAMENSHEGLRRMQEFSLSAKTWVDNNFKDPFVRGVMLNWAMAPQILPEQEGAGQSFYIMIPAIHVFGQSIPEGGSQELPNAMMSYVKASGGSVHTGTSVSKFLIEDGACVGLCTESGEEIRARLGVVSALEPKQTFLRFVGEEYIEPEFKQQVETFSFGKITICRVHYALKEAPRFANGELMSSCPFHRIVDSEAQLFKQYAEIAQGIPPTDPFLWSACWTLVDSSRAPDGQHTLIFDTFVSNWLHDGRTWDDIREDYVDDILLPKLQQYAPNITEENILGRYIETRESLEAANPSFVDGVTTGGERIQAQLGYFRPFPGYAHYRSPIKNLYMTGPHCHPGGAISAMGTITANIMLEDFGMQKNDF